jgi:ATP-dependent RNA helicase DDX21
MSLSIIFVARTGTGKTLAFAIPTVEKLLRTMTEKDFYRGRYPRVLVLTPTRFVKPIN